MPITVTLTVTKGALKSRQFHYANKEVLIVGRMDDCAIVFPDAETTVSRYHCLIDIAPPSVMVRDFGSLNGTYLNGKPIGKRPEGMSVEAARKLRTNEFYVNSGDRLQLGPDCEITVHVSMPQYCSNCFREIESVEHKNQAGMALCGDCHSSQKQNAQKRFVCEFCGNPLRDQEKQLAICESCYKVPEKAIQYLMKRAQGGDSALKDIANLRIVDRIGIGGMGEVFRVTDPSHRRYALKIMLPSVAGSDWGRKSFFREAQLMSQLNHKNIVCAHQFGAFAVGKRSGLYYILMELCDGGDLHALIRKSGGKLGVEMATDFILQTLDGLIYAHSAGVVATDQEGKPISVTGIVHRDLKPENILISSDANKQVAKVADFGLAKAFEIAGLSGHTFTGAKAGTPQFMPRRQVIDFRYANPAVDVWSAAAIYYYSLTGSYPKDFTKGDHFVDALNNQVVPIRKRNAGIPKRLAEVIDWALVEKPEIGIQSAAELKKQIIGVL